MALLVDILRVFSVVNVLLLVGLSYVWVQNYRRFRTDYALGLLVFGALLLFENLLWTYFYILDPVLSQWITMQTMMGGRPQVAMAALCVAETGGLLFLSWVTYR